MKIQILVDNPDSWIVPYAKDLVEELKQFTENCRLIHLHSEVEEGDILCLLSCEKIFKDLGANKHNLVVHESDLPKGKGWSPVTWQVLEGVKKIPVTLFEADEAVDSGVIYNQAFMELEGHELLEEIKHLQGVVTKELIISFVKKYPNNIGTDQEGEESFYERRRPVDSQLDVNKSIADQFNLFRVSDNRRYPAWFEIDGQKYKLMIEKC